MYFESPKHTYKIPVNCGFGCYDEGKGGAAHIEVEFSVTIDSDADISDEEEWMYQIYVEPVWGIHSSGIEEAECRECEDE
ncbi:hypothetical protein L0Y49_00825 [bacterium]|nr:hypothetical protein [bacterium]